jgi:hypothetical protein
MSGRFAVQQVQRPAERTNDHFRGLALHAVTPHPKQIAGKKDASCQQTTAAAAAQITSRMWGSRCRAVVAARPVWSRYLN